MPGLTCLKNTGPGDSSFIMIARSGASHDRIKIMTNNENAISKALLKNLAIGSWSGVFLKDSTGKNS